MSEYLHATWCDDIRHETSGKFILVGCYGSQLIANEFPIRLFKLCVQFHLVTEKFDETQNLTITVNRDDQPDLELAKLSADLSPNGELEAENGVITIQGDFALNMLEIEKETTLRLSAQIGEKSFTGPSLQIMSRQQLNG